MNRAPGPTYRKGGIDVDMQGSGATRIDTILANLAASHLCQHARYCIQGSTSFDHVPLFLTLNIERFQDMASFAMQPVRIDIHSLIDATQQKRDQIHSSEGKLFTRIWKA